jgi:hypothetical protein
MVDIAVKSTTQNIGDGKARKNVFSHGAPPRSPAKLCLSVWGRTAFLMPASRIALLKTFCMLRICNCFSLGLPSKSHVLGRYALKYSRSSSMAQLPITAERSLLPLAFLIWISIRLLSISSGRSPLHSPARGPAGTVRGALAPR